jgi:ABC-type branched-subunit amino acid transport system permease subunit
MSIQLSLLVFAVLALTATVGIYWLARARAGRRWRAVLDAYVEREQTKRSYSGTNLPART